MAEVNELLAEVFNNYTYEDVIDGDFAVYNDNQREGARGHIAELPVLDFLKLIFVIGARVGYVLIQTGSIPVANIYLIIYHNIIEFAIATFSFGTLGMLISSGFSSAKYSLYWEQWNKCISARSSTGLSAVLIGTAQMSTFLVGRIHLGGAILLITIYSALYQPMLMYLVWPTDGVLIDFRDNKGGTGLFTLVAYIPSTIVGLVGSLFLGRRLVRIKDIDEFSLGNEHVVGTTIGYLMIVFGYTVLGLPVQDDDCHQRSSDVETPLPGKVLIYNMLAAATGIIVVSLLYYAAYKDTQKYWLILRFIQGGLAGMITTSAANYTVVWKVFVVAALGALLFFILTQAIHNTALEDWCNMTASHLACGFLGAMIWPLFQLLFNKDVLMHILFTLVIVVMTAVFAAIMFLILNVAGILRNKYEMVDHQRAMNVLSNLPDKGYLERMFMISDSKTPHIIPGSYRKRYIPESQQNLIGKEGKNSSSLKDKGKDPSNKKRRAVDMAEHRNVIRDEKKSAYPIIADPLNIWPSTGSGDYYRSII